MRTKRQKKKRGLAGGFIPQCLLGGVVTVRFRPCSCDCSRRQTPHKTSHRVEHYIHQIRAHSHRNTGHRYTSHRTLATGSSATSLLVILPLATPHQPQLHQPWPTSHNHHCVVALPEHASPFLNAHPFSQTTPPLAAARCPRVCIFLSHSLRGCAPASLHRLLKPRSLARPESPLSLFWAPLPTPAPRPLASAANRHAVRHRPDSQ